MQLKLVFRNSILLVLALVMLPCANSKEETYEQAALTLIEQMRTEDFSAAVESFDEKLQTALPAEKLSTIWQQVVAQAGQFEEVLNVSHETSGANTMVVAATKFTNVVLDIKISINQNRQIAGLFFAPSKYRPKVAASNNSVKAVKFGDNEWLLSGEVTYPQKGDKFPLVILVHGSGPQDMDHTIGPNKPFLDIAKALAKAGIATLRYNKRTYEHQGKYAQNPETIADITLNDETIIDAVHAFKFAQSLDKIDSSKIYIAGISQGGMAIPRIAEQANAAGYIMLAAPARRLDVLVAEQYQYIMNLDGSISPTEQVELNKLDMQINNLNALTAENSTTSSELPLGLPAAYWLDLKNYNAVAEAKNIKKPLLIVQGGRDYQVLANKDFKIWQHTFNRANNVTLTLLPKLNHIMHKGNALSTPSEYMQASAVDGEFIDTLSNWIKAH